MTESIPPLQSSSLYSKSSVEKFQLEACLKMLGFDYL